MSRLGSLGHRLYSGEISYNIVGHRKRWYIASTVLVLVSLLSLFVRGLNLGIEFHGGAEFQVPAATCSIDNARSAVQSAGVNPVTVTQLGSESIRITTETVDQATSTKVRSALADQCKVTVDDVSAQVVGPTWGGEITKKAVYALGVFLALLAAFLIVYFDWRMAIAAMIALIHDIVITVGVYSLLQFEVTPSTVIGILTILGYSLYDTVVVFDKVKENTHGILGQARQTYAQAANLAVNQTLVRSINTSIVALLPVGSILFVGAGLLGAGTLKDLALALFVGMAVGAYSSIFVATPLLVDLMERDPQIQAQAKRVESRASGLAAKGAGGTRTGKGRKGSRKGGAGAAPAASGAAPAGVDVIDPSEDGLAGAGSDAAVSAASGAAGSAATGSRATGSAPKGSDGGLESFGGDADSDLDPSADAMARARARRAAGQRNQPKRNSRSKR